MEEEKNEDIQNEDNDEAIDNDEIKSDTEIAEGEPSDMEVAEGKYLRALADYQNLLRQTAREKEEFAKYANEQLLLEIIPVYDNLKMALAHVDETAKNNGLAEGIKYVIKQFADVLKNHNVEEIKTDGEKFDHNTMEAVQNEPTDDEQKDDFVAKELSSGYKLGGKVIKAARVTVYEFKK